MRKTLALVFLLTGCGGAQRNLPIIDATLSSVRGVTHAVKEQRIAKKDVVGCYVASSLLTASSASQEAVDAWVKGEGKTGVIPAVEVNVSECNALLLAPLDPLIPAKAEEKVRGIVAAFEPFVFAGLESLVGVADLSCKNRVIADAVLSYMKGSLNPVIDELGKPDGKIEIPAVMLDMRDCKEGDIFREPAAAPGCACAPCKDAP